jgi:transposase
MQAVTTIGLDIAKSIFQVHGVDAEGNVVVRRRLKRRYVVVFFQKLPPCLVGIEACAFAADGLLRDFPTTPQIRRRSAALLHVSR